MCEFLMSFVRLTQSLNNKQTSDHEWKNKFFIDCLSPILETIVSVNTPPYQKTVELDKKIRNFPIPEILKEDYNAGSGSRSLAMQRALLSTGRDIGEFYHRGVSFEHLFTYVRLVLRSLTALLQLHRRPFMELLNNSEQFDWDREFAPSLLATYLSTSSIIGAVETLFNKEEQLSGRFLCFWFNAFSASVSALISK